MLFSFLVENYRTIKMDSPMYFGPGVTLIFGICGSGKSNYCNAIRDILLSENEWQSDCKSVFFYEFEEMGNVIGFSYRREKDGKIQWAEVKIDNMEFCYVYEKETSAPGKILKTAKKFAAKHGQKKAEACLERCIREISQRFQCIMNENYEGMHLNEWNKTYDIVRRKREYEKSNSVDILIIDDVDCIEDEEIRKDRIWKEARQTILFARRSKWIDEKIAPLDNYYCMRNGKPIKMISLMKKEIISVKQLKNLFQKGVFEL